MSSSAAVEAAGVLESSPAAVRGVVEHRLDHAGDDRRPGAHAAVATPENERSNDLGSDNQTLDITWEFGSGKRSSWSAARPARIPLAASAGGVFGASIPASMSVSIPPG